MPQNFEKLISLRIPLIRSQNKDAKRALLFSDIDGHLKIDHLSISSSLSEKACGP